MKAHQKNTEYDTARQKSKMKKDEDVEVEGLDLAKIRAQRRAKSATRMKDVEKVFNKKAKPTKSVDVPPRLDAPDRGYFEDVITSKTVMGGQEFEVKEVSPPGWGHTKAEKEKTKPNKPKSKIGGSAHEFDKDLKSGKFKGLPGDKTMKDKKASMFKLMWSMKNKGEKPHYKPGVKDKLKAKYKDESVLDSAKRYLIKNDG